MSDRPNKLQPIIEMFIEGLAERMVIMHLAMGILDDSQSPASDRQLHVEKFKLASHNLAGTAGSLGFNAMTDKARALELAIDDCFSDRHAKNAAPSEQMHLQLQELQAEANAILLNHGDKTLPRDLN